VQVAFPPSSGRELSQVQGEEERSVRIGRVLSFTKLQAVPEGLKEPHNLALVGIDKGPKIVCWTTATLNEDDEVAIADVGGSISAILWTSVSSLKQRAQSLIEATSVT